MDDKARADNENKENEKNTKITFRFAKRGDCGLILRFIRELAAYERMENEVVATEEKLDEWLFEKHAAEVLFPMANGKETGFALFFTSFSTFLGQAGLYLEDLYILPEHRGHGIGTAVLRELALISAQRGYGRLEWACLDWNTPSIEFYKSLGANPMNEWTTYRLSGDNLSELAAR